MSRSEETIRQAMLEALINAVVIFAASLGLLILAKQSGQLSSDIGYTFISMQSTAIGLIRFATYMYQNEDSVTPGNTLEFVVPSNNNNNQKHKGWARLPHFFKTHQVGKVI